MKPSIMEKRGELEALCARHHVRRLDLFGSAAGREGRDTRDLDFLVEFEALAPRDYADAYLGLLQSLEDLFQTPIDLVERTTVSNPYLLRGIERSKLPLYAT